MNSLRSERSPRLSGSARMGSPTRKGVRGRQRSRERRAPGGAEPKAWAGGPSIAPLLGDAAPARMSLVSSRLPLNQG